MAQVRPERAARRTDGLTDGLVRLRPRLRRPRDSRPGGGGGGSRRAAMAADSREEKGERGGWGPRAAGEGTGEPRRAGGRAGRRAGGAGGAGLASSGRSRGLAGPGVLPSWGLTLRTRLVAVPGAVGEGLPRGACPQARFLGGLCGCHASFLNYLSDRRIRKLCHRWRW